MLVADALRAAAEALAPVSDTARLDAELLMAHALGLSRSDMLLRAMRDPAPEGFAALVDRRAAHEPVAYITGVAEFYGRSFAVSRDVLIPRPDSETLIEAALEWAGGRERLRILDLGTGSGALLLTLLAELPFSTGEGIDASAAAANVARYNARVFDAEGLLPREGISRELGRHTIRRRDWRIAGWTDRLGTFDLIVSNPPYVEETADLDPQVRDFEPASALFAGPEGLDDYRILIPQLRALMRPGAVAILEIGAKQAAAVSALAQAAGFTAELRRDLAGRARALLLA